MSFFPPLFFLFRLVTQLDFWCILITCTNPLSEGMLRYEFCLLFPSVVIFSLFFFNVCSVALVRLLQISFHRDLDQWSLRYFFFSSALRVFFFFSPRGCFTNLSELAFTVKLEEMRRREHLSAIWLLSYHVPVFVIVLQKLCV